MTVGRDGSGVAAGQECPGSSEPPEVYSLEPSEGSLELRFLAYENKFLLF